ncbi:Flagellar biosynthesis protein FliQ [Citrobacter freundii]|uniref:Flagellar biosynthesis protein FliQ n=1 Tax=Citrobacter freundii TaxID=546 RepID=A0A7G2J052_CITFR|nr:Flagellar biosynthesis protein FliQ [Citrobacter freundii]
MNTQATVSQPAAVSGSPLVQVSGALLGIIVLILAVAWVIKRLGFAPKKCRYTRAESHGQHLIGST